MDTNCTEILGSAQLARRVRAARVHVSAASPTIHLAISPQRTWRTKKQKEFRKFTQTRSFRRLIPSSLTFGLRHFQNIRDIRSLAAVAVIRRLEDQSMLILRI